MRKEERSEGKTERVKGRLIKGKCTCSLFNLKLPQSFTIRIGLSGKSLIPDVVRLQAAVENRTIQISGCIVLLII